MKTRSRKKGDRNRASEGENLGKGRENGRDGW